MDTDIMEHSLLPRIPLPKLLRLAGLVSILGALGDVAADSILQYNPHGQYLTAASMNVASWRVYAGHFLGIAAIPLEIVGYWLLCRLLLEQWPRIARVLFWVMAYSIIIGVVFHGLFLPLIFAEQASSASSAQVSSLQYGIIPLAAVFLLCYLVMWSIFIVLILRRPSIAFPRWLAMLTPAAGSILITLLYESQVLPLAGNLLYPAVLSLPHLVFFSALTFLVWKRTTAPLLTGSLQ